jgi:hypothetical protein
MGKRKRSGALSGVGEVAEAILRRNDRSGGLAGARVCAAWEDVAGPAVAAHSRAVRVTEGELLVAVDSPAWANELALMSASYVAELQRRAGKDSVRAIRFTVSRNARAHTERRAEGQAEQTAVRPTEHEVRAAMQAVPGNVSDPALREAMARALAALRKARASGDADTTRKQH